jgi:glucokinase
VRARDFSLADSRVVMTLDAGGTSFRFAAMRGGRAVTETLALPSHADDLERCLATLTQGFLVTRERCPESPAAISFAFPGPADYGRGVILAPPNMPAFREGVALGPMLEDRFGVPVFINNDGALFAFGEAIGGLLPEVNALLAQARSARRYRHLVAVTLGTGFGGGLALDGELHVGDNSVSGEVWLFRNKLHPETNAEEGACIRAVRRVYAEHAGIALDDAPEPRVIFEIGSGLHPGHAAAAVEAFRQLGEVAGDAIAHACSLVDALVVVGGGISGSWPLFMPALVCEMNGTYLTPDGQRRRRLTPTAFNLQDPEDLRRFLQADAREIAVPGSDRRVSSETTPRTGVGVTRLGTSQAIAIGAYAFALGRLAQARHGGE